MPSGSRIVLRTAAEADVPTPDTDQTALFMDADASNAPAYKDDGGVVHPLAGADGADGELSYTPHGSTGSTETVDVSTNVHQLVANAATVTLTLTGAPGSGVLCISRLYLFQDGTGGRDWAFPGSVTFGDAGEPDWTDRGPNDLDVVDLTTLDGGTTYYAVVVGRPGAVGAAGSNGTNGVDGSVGGAISIDYTFSTTTTDSDPGSGNLRVSNATQTSATTIRADLLDAHGTDWTAVLDTLADASNTVKGHIRLFKKSDPTKWLVYTVSAIASPAGYRNITVANVGSSGVNPLTNGDSITLAFSRSGDQGSTVGSGTLTTIEEVDGSPTDSAVTKLVFPNGTLGIASHVATYTPATPAVTAGTILGLTAYNPTATDTTISGTTQADVDATNLIVTFTAPASGNVLVRLECKAYAENAGARLAWGIRESSTDVIGPVEVLADGTAGPEIILSRTFYITGVSAGSHTYKWAAKRTTANCNMRYGGVYGQAVMQVIAAP